MNASNQRKKLGMVCRFDVALVTITQNSQPTIVVIENAFTESP